MADYRIKGRPLLHFSTKGSIGLGILARAQKRCKGAKPHWSSRGGECSIQGACTQNLGEDQAQALFPLAQ